MNLLMVDSAEAAEPCPDPDSGDAGAGPSENIEQVRQLVLAHYEAVYRYAFRLTGLVADAEDVTQQTFLIAQRKLHQLRDADKADRWLFAILRSCYLKSRRKQRPVPAANLELNVDELPEESVRQLEQSNVDQERLQRALGELSDEHKLILLMFYFEDLSYKEISAQLNVKIGTVMSRLSRAKGWLRKCLLSFEEGPSARGDSGSQRQSASKSASSAAPR
jgi:RNA polymerase sigma-70 factor (ECF subfamily)